jgi:hypothetical protein
VGRVQHQRGVRAGGHGPATTDLYDARAHVGRAAQTLLVKNFAAADPVGGINAGLAGEFAGDTG